MIMMINNFVPDAVFDLINTAHDDLVIRGNQFLSVKRERSKRLYKIQHVHIINCYAAPTISIALMVCNIYWLANAILQNNVHSYSICTLKN